MALALCMILIADTATAVRSRLILDDPVGMVFLDDMAASPNLRIAIALQMVRNSIGGTRSASDRSDTVICFVPSVKSFAAQ